jgi:hypothetical protein
MTLCRRSPRSADDVFLTQVKPCAQQPSRDLRLPRQKRSLAIELVDLPPHLRPLQLLAP